MALREHKTEVGFLRCRKSMLGRMEDMGSSCTIFLVACASITMSRLQSPTDTYPCKYINMSISADVYSATAGSSANVWADPYDSSTKKWKAGHQLLRSHMPFHYFSQGHSLIYRWSILHSCAERGGRRRGEEYRHSSQFIKSDSAHALLKESF